MGIKFCDSDKGAVQSDHAPLKMKGLLPELSVLGFGVFVFVFKRFFLKIERLCR